MTPTAQLDVMAVLASLQEQVEDLTIAVQKHQRTLDTLTASRPPQDS